MTAPRFDRVSSMVARVIRSLQAVSCARPHVICSLETAIRSMLCRLRLGEIACTGWYSGQGGVSDPSQIMPAAFCAIRVGRVANQLSCECQLAVKSGEKDAWHSSCTS